MKVSDINFKDPMQKKLQNIYIILSNESVLIEENLE